MLFGGIGCLWILSRQAETLPRPPPPAGTPHPVGRPARGSGRPRGADLYHRSVSGLWSCSGASVLGPAALQAMGKHRFPKWFALMAVLAGTGSLFNARFVERLGMRRIATDAYDAGRRLGRDAGRAGDVWARRSGCFPCGRSACSSWRASRWQPQCAGGDAVDGPCRGWSKHAVTGSVSTVLAMLIAVAAGAGVQRHAAAAAGGHLCSSLALWLMHRARNSA